MNFWKQFRTLVMELVSYLEIRTIYQFFLFRIFYSMKLFIASKTVMNWSSQNKKEGILCTVYFVRREFFQDLFYLNV